MMPSMKVIRDCGFVFLFGSLCAFGAGEAPVQLAQGRVFHDLNRNGSMDSGEDGIGSVLVSNGSEVVATDEQGAYQLPVGEDSMIFVIQPKGWQVAVDPGFLPRFYYNHKPKGSPEALSYPGLAPTGPLPRSIDFPLYPWQEFQRFSFFVFGDPQPYSLEEVEFFRRDIIEEARQLEEPVAGVSLGDIVGDDLSLFEPVNAAIAAMQRPWWHVQGNHDLNFDVEEREFIDETFERNYGPSTYAFEIGEVVFIVLNNVLYPNTHTSHAYTGGFSAKQLRFVEQLLKHVSPNRLVVSMMHIPLFDESYGDTFVDEHREAFFKLFERHPHTLSLSAHTHTQNHFYFDAVHHGWPHREAPHHHYNVGTTSGSWWAGDLDERGIPSTTMRDGVPNGYAILHFDGNQYRCDWQVANGPEAEVMRLHAPKALQFSDRMWSNAQLGINVYNGCEQTRVEYRVAGGKWKTATRQLAADPAYTYERLRRDHLELPAPGHPLPFPSLSTHQWFAPLPAHLDPGRHLVEVRVTDRYGRVFRDSLHYRILPRK
jgi:hypothetical protein